MDASDDRRTCTLDQAMDLVAFLRAHCPWDGKQTPRTLTKHLLEEAHEVVEAIFSGNESALADELGDLLLNLAFQLVIAEEQGRFDRTSVWEGLDLKMRRRHPHLFGLGEEASWEDVKASEDDGRDGALSGVPRHLPALARASMIQRRASAVGFDWDEPTGALEKVREETDEVAGFLGGPVEALEEELGDLLFSVVNLARLAGVDPYGALTRANLKFERRFNAVEAAARFRGLPMPGTDLEVLDRLWDEVKAEEENEDGAGASG